MNNAGIVNRIVRTSVKVVLGLVVLGAAIFGGLAVYNAFDEELSAEAKAILAPRQMGRIEDQNGYIAFLGMGAPMGQDQMAWGRKAAEAFTAQAKPGFARSPEWDSAVKSHLQASKTAAWCTPDSVACLPVAKERSEALAKVLADEQNSELLMRYRKVREAPGYSDLYAGPGILVRTPDYRRLFEGASLARLEIATKAIAGDLEWASAELEREAAFHRRIIAGAGTLASAMVANRLLAFDLLVASELLQSGGEQLAPHRARLREVAKAPPGVRMLEVPLAHEAHANVSFASDLRQKFRDQRMRGYYSAAFGELLSPLTEWTMSFFVRSNETANLAARYYEIDRANTRVAAAGFAAAAQGAREAKKPLLERPWYAEGRNPVGKGVLELITTELSSNISRMHDLDALARMVDLQVTLAERGISEPPAIAAFVAGEGAKSHANPFTGKAFSFDAVMRQLAFTPLQNSSLLGAMQKRYKQKSIAILL